MGTRWVTLDCFGTLVDWNAGFSNVLKPLLGPRTDEVLRAYHGFERELEAGPIYRTYREILAAGVSLAAAKAGITLTGSEARTLPEQWAALPLFGDVEEMLAGLRKMGYRLAVLTNCDEDLFSETQRAFQQPFDLVVTAERVRAYKPSPAHFRTFAEITGVARSDWVHVACSWYHDIAPARTLGIRRIWLDRDLTGDDASAASARVLDASKVCETVQMLDGPNRPEVR